MTAFPVPEGWPNNTKCENPSGCEEVGVWQRIGRFWLCYDCVCLYYQKLRGVTQPDQMRFLHDICADCGSPMNAFKCGACSGTTSIRYRS